MFVFMIRWVGRDTAMTVPLKIGYHSVIMNLVTSMGVLADITVYKVGTVNLREFFAEHYFFFLKGVVIFHHSITRDYNKAFPSQAEWFNTLMLRLNRISNESW